MKKKVFKIIQVVYDIISLAFIVFVIVAMAVTPKSEGHHEYNTSDIVEVKARDNLYDDGTYHYVGIGEVGSYQFYSAFIDNIKSYEYIYNTNITTMNFLLGQPTTINFDTPRIYQGHFNEGSYIVDRECTSLFIELDRSASFEDTITYDFTLFYRSMSSYDHFKVVARYIYSSEDKNDVITNNATYLGSSLFFYEFDAFRYSGIEALFPSNYIDGNTQWAYDEGFKAGSKEGYNKAVIDILNPDSVQYQYIYDLGKQEGLVEGMRGTESNAFVVIGQAFASVGSVLSIEVMPNLPLWVLVFTPLIVAVVIVVVKLIKG